MKTTRRQAAEKALLKAYPGSYVENDASKKRAIDLLVHVMKAEHARHASGNVCKRKPNRKPKKETKPPIRQCLCVGDDSNLAQCTRNARESGFLCVQCLGYCEKEHAK